MANNGSLQHEIVHVLLLLASLAMGILVLPSVFWETDLVKEPAKVILCATGCHLVGSLAVHCLGPLSRHSASKSVVQGLVRGVIGSVVGTGLVHTGAALLGAPPHRVETLLLSALITQLAVTPSAATLSWECGEPWRRVLARLEPQGPLEQTLSAQSHGAVLGAWVGAFTIPLDWDRPWQVWPIPCAVGASIGYAIGILVALVICAVHAFGKTKTA